ncbi:polysaccharide biosynthesis/export family protein [Muriicola sp. Z0-33]|uniref:polysaccharide biosynthesis/export family protein n=1 Tax=Muriicola sp. Z0-33 TaxID=2816957 RepID=UPI002237D258|nr:polysaccharide biosynthesis/export family protein [Muriicola sp. Z0-33]MCW5517995.1 polysaccharide biosynthesis/export family protein [Muriicola sp. Z0-33]
MKINPTKPFFKGQIVSLRFPVFKFFVIFLVALHLASCINTRKVTYFNDVGEDRFLDQFENLEPVLQKNDILSISVSSLNPEAAEIFNVSNLTATQSFSSEGITTQASGYLIDQEGFIRFPILGRLQAAGLTKSGLREKITKALNDQQLLLDPIVDVRYLNYKVAVLGEVQNPSVLTIPNEKVSLLEALGLAGDLTIYAKRDNVLLIREKDGVKMTHRIDLTTEELLSSPYYYLQSNDIIYVQPNKSKVASTSRAILWLPVILSALSLGIIAIDRY